MRKGVIRQVSRYVPREKEVGKSGNLFQNWPFNYTRNKSEKEAAHSCFLKKIYFPPSVFLMAGQRKKGTKKKYKRGKRQKMWQVSMLGTEKGHWLNALARR
jgi:hypothetical protein